MIQRPEERLPTISPRLALRVAVLGFVALALFAIVFFRLWYLQVLTPEHYLAQARENRVREMRIPAPRGDIVDRDGEVLVTNERAVVVSLDPSRLPEVERDLAATWGQQAGRRERRPKGEKGEPVPIPDIPTRELERRFTRLGKVLGISAQEIQSRVIRSLAVVPYSNVTLEIDAPRSKLNYFAERQSQFRGVEIGERYMREYPHGDLAAQLFGTVGEISPDQLEEERYRDVEQGQVIGQEGLERSYDRYLRGRPGVRRVVVDAFGRRKAEDRLPDIAPVSGRRLRLSIDFDLQQAGQKALRRVAGNLPAAFVALDPRNGQVLAMGSQPSFDPELLTKPITQERYDRLFGDQAGAPRFNRAISSVYPVGSTFKPITAIGMLQEDLITPAHTIVDRGAVTIGAQRFQNAKATPYGAVDLVRAITVSSDVYFYLLGAQNNGAGEKEDPIQRWARRLGLDEPTGIDLPGEAAGTVPDRGWRAERAKLELDCRKEKDVRSCGLSDGRPWSIGDSVQLAIGQGDVQATPLQMAVAYSAIANGGKVVTPHVGQEVTDATGIPEQSIETEAARTLKLEEDAVQAVRAGLRGAASGPGGTSTAVFADWPHDRLAVHGKTGTAERIVEGRPVDQSWYVAFVRDGKRPIVVATTIERGGFGSDTAAPATCLMLAEWFDVDSGCVAGGGQE